MNVRLERGRHVFGVQLAINGHVGMDEGPVVEALCASRLTHVRNAHLGDAEHSLGLGAKVLNSAY